MVRKMLSLIVLSLFLAIGGLWGLRAQDPAPQKPQQPATMPEPQKPATQTEPQKPATQAEAQKTTAATSTQVDLSGSYAGTFNCEPAGLVGDTTLTINGNEFTTADGKTGRITATKTNRYTAVALQVNGADPNAPSTIISMRAKKSGNKLTLSPVPGATKQCSFAMGKVAKGRKTPAATGTEVANPSAVPTASPMQTPSPSPTPNPSPTPSGSPHPMPSPTASPSPTEPMPSPTPSPSPSPAPGL